jgi:hypothetical protein
VPDQPLNGLAVDARKPGQQALDLEQQHQPDHVVGRIVTTSGSMGFQQVFLQLTQLVAGDLNICQRPETRIDAVKPLVGFL